MNEKKLMAFTSKIHDTLDILRIRSSMFLSAKSISALEDFISGYMVFGKWGFYDRDLIYNKGDVDLNEFRFWIQDIDYIHLSSGPRFSSFLLQKCDGDEEKAFDLFFKLLDQFKAHKKLEEQD